MSRDQNEIYFCDDRYAPVTHTKREGLAVIDGPLVRDLVLLLEEVKAAKEALANKSVRPHFRPRGDNGHSKAKN